jgi:hypothetical protein
MCFTSCKKDYTCTCKYTYAGETETEKFEYKDVKKKDAKSACDLLNTLASGEGTCSLD